MRDGKWKRLPAKKNPTEEQKTTNRKYERKYRINLEF